VLSFPPIINSEHTKITVNTRNIFIELTATDQTKLSIVTNIVATMFSEHCEEPFTYVLFPSFDTLCLTEMSLLSIEPVKIIYPDGRVVISPDLSSRQTQANASYINACTGLNLSASQVKDLLERMSLRVELSPGDTDTLNVNIPPTRPDILHECDIMEDAAIAYGYNKLPDMFPATSTVAQPLAVNKLSDTIRHEWAYAGWVEVLPLILVGHLSPPQPSASASS
jgi:phenylalanyl-tRNA synthetase beta chain